MRQHKSFVQVNLLKLRVASSSFCISLRTIASSFPRRDKLLSNEKHSQQKITRAKQVQKPQ